ncbi:MAG TPA: DNA-directed RNA polymerase subunit alpha C-terminal domain-containing protein [Candidatus Nanoarchaeia archaeon]|nr:DNA-directed RNA polymerase subunit alpha C-terminal domain-containing protein [Candidatus Nanoarchaeia archaeon]
MALNETVQEMLKEVSGLRMYDLSMPVNDDLRGIHKEVLAGRIRQLEHKYGKQLEGTPERAYLTALVNHYDPITPESPLHPRNDNSNLYKTLDEIELEVKPYNALTRNGQEEVYIGDVAQMTDNQLLLVKNFGRVSLGQVKKVLRILGLETGMYLKNFRPTRESEKETYILRLKREYEEIERERRSRA